MVRKWGWTIGVTVRYDKITQVHPLAMLSVCEIQRDREIQGNKGKYREIQINTGNMVIRMSHSIQ